jgi:hypothetical protein
MSDFTPALVIPALAPATCKVCDADAPSGFVIVNVSDFDAATMTAFVDEPIDAPSKKPGK